MTKAAVFPSLPEFELISRLLKQSGEVSDPVSPRQRGWLGPGDDCAQFDGWLSTLDMSVEGTHFRLDWSSPEEAVEKCLLSNLSDINAMGGTPQLVLLGLCLNRNWTAEVRERVALAFARSCRQHGVRLIGGDTVVGDLGCFSVTMLGTAEHPPLLRSAARPGQDVYVSGYPGDSAGGLWLLEHDVERTADWAQELMAVHRVPRVPLNLGSCLAALGGIGACMDVSDGLSSELHHLALNSEVCIRIEESAIPVSEALRNLCRIHDLEPRSFWLHGGEEYGLLFTCDQKERVILKALPQVGELHRIGTVLPGQGVELLTVGGRLENINAAAWSHL